MGSKLKKDYVSKKIKSVIRNRELTISTKLPGETEFAAVREGVHITLRASLEELVKEVFVSLVQGKGTFITGAGSICTAGKILIVKDVIRSMRSISSCILSRFEKKFCKLQFITETFSVDFQYDLIWKKTADLPAMPQLFCKKYPDIFTLHKMLIRGSTTQYRNSFL